MIQDLVVSESIDLETPENPVIPGTLDNTKEIRKLIPWEFEKKDSELVSATSI